MQANSLYFEKYRNITEYFKGEAKMKTENSTRFGFAQTVITPDAQAVYLDGFGKESLRRRVSVILCT